MLLEGEAWSRHFRDFRSSAFRLELHPIYTMPGEADELRRFLAGERPPEGYHYGWLDTVATARSAGKTMSRVRVVRRPLSDYIRYEFDWGFAYNVAAVKTSASSISPTAPRRGCQITISGCSMNP